MHAEWANTLHRLIALEQTVQRHKYLQLCHQLQFTITPSSAASIFPTLHQPYLELSQLIDQCVKNNDVAQRWTPLSAWIQTKLNTKSSAVISATEIKVMLLLKIYYDYYCNAQLALLDPLITIIENGLQPSAEELRVFRVFLQPEQRMVGYLAVNNGQESNYLNSLFRLDCNDEDELSIRHALVNLLAMILLSGKDSFLWTFAFEPLALTNTFGKRAVVS